LYSPEEINEALDAAAPWVEVRKVEAEEELVDEAAAAVAQV
jgi:hypothetical protein